LKHICPTTVITFNYSSYLVAYNLSENNVRQSAGHSLSQHLKYSTLVSGHSLQTMTLYLTLP
ncbi:hypothetical protein P7M41_26795, partial [Vibrio parahaemolyticus]|nr:hypothetical protein [Vibrio parahaemolyticus]